MNWQIGKLPCKLAHNTIHVWQVNLDRLSDQFQWLNTIEQQRANKMPIAIHRQRFINARATLRQLLSNYLSAAPQAIELSIMKRGKLYLRTAPELKFNLTHSKNMAIYAFNYDIEIGIDLEVKHSLKNISGIAERVFYAIECEYLYNQKTMKTLLEKFFILWTRKEAIIKATGEGLAAAVTEITTTLADGQINPHIDRLEALNLQLHDLPMIKNCHAAIAAQCINKKLSYFILSN